MENKKRECPVCGELIDNDATICPICGAKTGFESTTAEEREEKDAPIEEVHEEETAAPPAIPQQSAAPEAQQPSEHDWQQPSEHEPKTDSSPIKKKKSKATVVLITVIILLAAIVGGIFVAVQYMNNKNKERATVQNARQSPIAEVIDSMASEVNTENIVARFPDKERHCLYYLDEGHLYKFDALDRKIQDINPRKLNKEALVNYDADGIVKATLSPDEKYIIIIATIDNSDEDNVKSGLYRLNTQSMNLTVLGTGDVTMEDSQFKVATDSKECFYDETGTKVSESDVETEESSMDAAVPEAQPKPAVRKQEAPRQVKKEEKKKAKKQEEDIPNKGTGFHFEEVN